MYYILYNIIEVSNQTDTYYDIFIFLDSIASGQFDDL